MRRTWPSLFLRKKVSDIHEQAEAEKHHFNRHLTAASLIAIGVGEIVGAGIFVLTGQAAAQYAGPAIVLSFIISGVACAFSALCYAELASMIPVAGSAYTYAYATLGELFAWIIGWDLALEYLFGAASVAVGWSGYVVDFLRGGGLEVPAQWAGAPLDFVHGQGWISTGAYLNFPAVFIVVVCTALLVLGIKASASLNNVIVFVKLTVILLLVAFGSGYIVRDNLIPFIPPNSGEFGHYGWSGVLRGAGVIFFAYIGFDAVSTTAQEAKNPQRDLPIGITGSLLIATLLYVAVAFVVVGMVPYQLLKVPDPLAVAINHANSHLLWLRPLIKIGAIAGLSTVILVCLLGQPRIMYSMSRDGLLPAWCGKLHPKFKTPYLSTLAAGAAAAVISGLFPIGILGELVSIGTLFAFSIVCVGVVVLRYIHPEINRPFKTPFSPWVPILGLITALAQMLALPTDTWLRLLVWMIMGFIVYALYGLKHSEMRSKDS